MEKNNEVCNKRISHIQ